MRKYALGLIGLLILTLVFAVFGGNKFVRNASSSSWSYRSFKRFLATRLGTKIEAALLAYYGKQWLKFAETHEPHEPRAANEPDTTAVEAWFEQKYPANSVKL